MSMVDTKSTEQKIAERINQDVAGNLAVSGADGGLAFVNMAQAMEFAKMMSVSSVAVPKHLRGNPGACMAVVIQAIEWKLSPYAVANKSYSVNDRLAYESQLIQAVILQRAPIKGRFKVEFKGDGGKRVCRVWAVLRDGEEIVDYTSPEFDKIQPKNSPLWKSDPDQQHFYYSGRALCRRHFLDVLLGVYAEDEMEPRIGPDHARDVTPARNLSAKLDALAAGGPPAHDGTSGDVVNDDTHGDAGKSDIDPETGEILNTEPRRTGAVQGAEAEGSASPAAASAPDAQTKPPARGAHKAPAAADADDFPGDQQPRRSAPVEWYEAGRKACRDGVSRKAVPEPLRGEDRADDLSAYRTGWDDESAAAG